MPPSAVRAQLRKIAAACEAGERALAAARLDFTTASTLRAWRLIPARTAAPGGEG